MDTRIEWAVALMKDLDNPLFVEYPNEDDATIASRVFHMWDKPVVMKRDGTEWVTAKLHHPLTLAEAIESLRARRS